MTHRQLIDLLLENGYTTGWCLQGETLTIWDYDEDPPPPLTRPEA